MITLIFLVFLTVLFMLGVAYAFTIPGVIGLVFGVGGLFILIVFAFFIAFVATGGMYERE